MVGGSRVSKECREFELKPNQFEMLDGEGKGGKMDMDVLYGLVHMLKGSFGRSTDGCFSLQCRDHENKLYFNSLKDFNDWLARRFPEFEQESRRAREFSKAVSMGKEIVDRDLFGFRYGKEIKKIYEIWLMRLFYFTKEQGLRLSFFRNNKEIYWEEGGLTNNHNNFEKRMGQVLWQINQKLERYVASIGSKLDRDLKLALLRNMANRAVTKLVNDVLAEYKLVLVLDDGSRILFDPFKVDENEVISLMTFEEIKQECRRLKNR